MIEAFIRPVYQKTLVDPVVKVVATFLPPNVVTIFAGILGLGVVCALVMGMPLVALLLLLLSGYCDSLDGSIARAIDNCTPLGTVFDICIDRTVEFLIILGLFFVETQTRALMCLLMLGSILVCVTSFLVVGIFSENQTEKSFYYSPGLMERPEAFTFFALMILFPAYFQVLALTFTGLVFFTALLRIVQFAQQITPPPKQIS